MKILLSFIIIFLSSLSINAQSLSEKIASGGKPILGFATEIPWAYPGDKGEPLGFVNAINLVILEEMGITEYETAVTDWGGLIPGMNANRHDIITGGMYILKSRCENVDFSDPIGIFGDAFLVKAGNPLNLHSYQDIVDTGATLVTGAGYNTVEAAKKYGVPDNQMLIVDGDVSIYGAMMADRADAAAVTVFTAQVQAAKSGGKFEVSDPTRMPKETLNVVGIGFKKTDTDFKDAYNEALAKVLGSEKWMAATAEYGYTELQLPPSDFTTEYACANK